MTEKQRVAPSRPTKLPSVTVICDDFEVVRDGKRFWPHAGQKLVISGQGSIDDVVLSMGLASLRELSKLSPEEALQAKETLELMLARSAEAIESWTWTDNKGDAYPSPPTVEVLRRCSPDEIAYINEKVIGGGEKADAAKNGSSPSTSRSTRRRAGGRRRSG